MDVFFVISGYLITLALLKEISQTGEISLRRFYARRIRRLLPVATFVLLTVAALIPLLPRTQWYETAIDVTGSALYIENWILAFRSVDYFSIGAGPSPLQHYWSLSVEEQFYIVWPIIILLAIYVANWMSRPTMAMILSSLLFLLISSLAISILSTNIQPEWSYFATYTRIWELALGGLMAFVGFPALRSLAAAILTGIGVIGVVASALIFSTDTPFPGSAALLPTIAAALIIVGGANSNLCGRVLGLLPFRYIGDRSYSIYLWHWPVIVFSVAIFGPELSLARAGVIILIVLVLSHLTFTHVENRFRYAAAGSPARRTLFYAMGSAACCIAATIIIVAVTSRYGSGVADADHPGPAVLLGAASAAADVPAIPPLEQIKRDLPEALLLGCHQDQVDPSPKACHFGNARAPVQLVLAGDSHALQWVSPLIEIVEDRGWGLTSYTKSACAFAKVDIIKQGDVPYENCAVWRKNVLREIRKARPDIVITSQSRFYQLDTSAADGTEVMAAGLAEVWKRLLRDGIKVIAIRDTPAFSFDPSQCMAEGRDNCGRSREEAFGRPDPIPLAAERTGARVVDMSDALCGPTVCDAVVGNVYPWRDDNHMTATYSRLTAPYLADRAGW